MATRIRSVRKQGRGRRGRRVLAVAGAAFAGFAVILAALWWQFGRQPSQEAPAISPEEAHRLLSDLDLAALEEKALQNQDDPSAVFALAEQYMTRAQWADAITWFTRYRQMDPDNQHAQIDIGIASMNLGLYGQAEDVFLNVLANDPDNVQVHFSLGFLYATSPIPSPSRAKAQFEEVIRLDPASPFAESARERLLQLGEG
ncbi:MAG: tetratricopeptide repeat protein [Chloroflexi bacterium]|nr:tetratricopeptide repeat protein [Chloroflexota bacterium]